MELKGILGQNIRGNLIWEHDWFFYALYNCSCGNSILINKHLAVTCTLLSRCLLREDTIDEIDVDDRSFNERASGIALGDCRL